jgi:hypothetical protein
VTGRTWRPLFDRESDLLLDLFRAERRGDRVDLDLYGRRVGEGVDIEIAQRDHAHDRQSDRAEHHGKSVAQRQVDDVVQHKRRAARPGY